MRRESPPQTSSFERSALEFRFGKTGASPRLPLQKGFCTDHVETYEHTHLDAHSHPQP